VQELIIDAVGGEILDTYSIEFDGRLTSIDAVPEVLRPKILATFEESGVVADAMPPALLPVLRLYDDVPGAWLLLDPFADTDTEPAADEAANVLLRAMVDVIGDGHLNALVKSAPFGWGSNAHLVIVIDPRRAAAGLMPGGLVCGAGRISHVHTSGV
jgi:hypothetical protein